VAKAAGAMSSSPRSRISAEKQVPEGLAHSQRQPSPPAMLVAVVQHVAALAKRLQIARAIVSGIVVEVGGGQVDPGGEDALVVLDRFRQARNGPPAPVAPRAGFLIPPSAITEMNDQAPVRPAAALATAFRAAEPDGGGNLRPVDRVKPAMLRTDRHQLSA
jgi:hypothetical protein